MTPETKACTRCNESKPLSDFYARKDRPAWSSACRRCLTDAQRKPPAEPRACEVCATAFTPRRNRAARFCSTTCNQSSLRRRRGQQPLAPAVVDGLKRCNTCEERKPVEEFTPRKNRNGAPISDCRQCMADRGRRYNQSDRGRNRRYALKYGVSLDWYERKLAEQAGMCPICQKPPRKGARLVIDHCHETGAARGLLCFLCNSAIGKLGDDVDTLRRAISYLMLSG